MTAKDSERPWGIFQRGEAAPRAWTTYFSGVDRLFSGVDHRHFRGVDQLSLSRTLSLLLSRSLALSLSRSLILHSRTGGPIVPRLKKVGVHLNYRNVLEPFQFPDWGGWCKR